MAETERADRARSFGEIADSYHRFRPGPPASAVEWVVPPSCDTAVDLGAGTGSLARRLLDRAARVIAVEPDPRMLAVLAAHSPHVAGIQAMAEHLPLATGSVDAVMISSEWHWMDADSTVEEVGRVLHRGGVLGVVWNGPDRSVEWVADLLRRRDAVPGDPDERRPRHRFELPSGSAFAGLETRVVTLVVADDPGPTDRTGRHLQHRHHLVLRSACRGVGTHRGAGGGQPVPPGSIGRRAAHALSLLACRPAMSGAAMGATEAVALLAEGTGEPYALAGRLIGGETGAHRVIGPGGRPVVVKWDLDPTSQALRTEAVALTDRLRTEAGWPVPRQ
jgi:SAM-dependent methyltransferase